MLEELGYEDASDEDCANVRYICEAVSRRAAHIAAAAVACLLNKMGQKHVTVAVDGSLYRFHPHFHDLMVEKIRQLINPGLTVSSFFQFFQRSTTTKSLSILSHHQLGKITFQVDELFDNKTFLNENKEKPGTFLKKQNKWKFGLNLQMPSLSFQ